MASKAYIIIILSMLKIVATQYECFENEIFTVIIDPCNLCEIRSSCPQYSGPTCDCLPGYLKNSVGQCVPPEECDRPPYIEPNLPEEIQCSIPVCREGCIIDYNTKPCPSCKCDQLSAIQCSIPVCKEGCDVDYDTKPCPSCKCDQNYECPQIRCRQGCYLDNNAKPCPRCVCDSKNKDDVGRRLRCGRNEFFNACGSRCPPTCGNPNPSCTKECVRGCFCRKGFLRGKSGICVLASRCPRSNPSQSSDPKGGIGPRSRRYGYSSNRPAYPPAVPPPLPQTPPPLPPPPPPPLPLPGAYSPGISPGISPGADPSGISPGTSPGISPGADPSGISPGTSPDISPGISPGTSPGTSPEIPPEIPPETSPGISPGIPPGAYPSGIPPGISPEISPETSPGILPGIAPVDPLETPGISPPFPRANPEPPLSVQSSGGCPNRRRCIRHCRSLGYSTGFCVGRRFLHCNCM